MPLGGGLTIGLSALGGLLSNRGGTTKQQSTSNSTQHQDSTSNPVYDDKSQALRDILINYYLDNLKSNGDFFDGYAREGAGQIAEGQQSAQRSIAQLLAARGIRGDAAGAGLAMPVVQGQKSMSTFLNSIPQLQDARQQGILQSGSQFLSSLPVGQHTVSDGTSTTNTTGTNTTPSNMLGGLFGNAGIAAAGIYGNQANNSAPAPAAASSWAVPGTSGVNPNWSLPSGSIFTPSSPSWLPNLYNGGKK